MKVRFLGVPRLLPFLVIRTGLHRHLQPRVLIMPNQDGSGAEAGRGAVDSVEDRQGDGGVLTFATTVRSRVIGADTVHTTLRHLVMGMAQEEAQGDARTVDGVVHHVKVNSSNLHFSCQLGRNPALGKTTTEGPHRTPRTEGLRTPYCL
ncbi:hypothetical protein XENORESO_021544 [Xenotaenia resolanae]|uniref:Secreted protein n=1 Tax=Xenotaenia resolanae TaxID=208358 RepID=A0ABV0VRN2_9TELE